MQVPTIQAAEPHFVERDAFLFAVLGAIACCERFDRLLELGPPGPQAERRGAGESELLDGLLGLFAARASFGRLVARCIRDGDRARAARTAAANPPLPLGSLGR